MGLFLFLFPAIAAAGLQVVATTTDLAALTRRVGGEHIRVEALAKGTQDPHSLEAKPSFMLRLSKADLLLSNGLGLETGWLPSLLRGARNPALSGRGLLELGPQLDPLEVPAGKLSRSEGDVHPEGNPHFTLDPIRMGKAAMILAARLGELDPPRAAAYSERAAAYAKLLEAKLEPWKKRVSKPELRKLVTYHKTLSYFLERFGLVSIGQLEPKPGIPPGAAQLLALVAAMKESSVRIVLIENYFDDSIGKKLRAEVPALRVERVPVQVEGEPGISSTEELIERLVRALEGV